MQILVLLPIEDGDGADDGEEVEDALEGLRQRRVERDEVERALGFVGRHIIGKDVHLDNDAQSHNLQLCPFVISP